MCMRIAFGADREYIIKIRNEMYNFSSTSRREFIGKRFTESFVPLLLLLFISTKHVININPWRYIYGM